jgi:hypothetical protein
MLREGVPKATRKQAWRVLSAALGWAASSNTAPSGAPPSLRSCKKTSPSGARRSRPSGAPSALDFIIPRDLAGPEHGVRDPRTGAYHFSENQARAWGERFSHPPSRKQPNNPSSSRSSAPPPTPCAAAASPCACAPRTHKPSPASAAPAYAHSASATPTRSRTSVATDHARRTLSGVPREPNKPNAKR